MAGGGIKINNIKVSGGADGITFIPSVDASGNLSWQAKRGNNVLDDITVPETVNIKGKDGKDGKDGEKGATGSKLLSQVLSGTDENGNNIYTQTFEDGTTATFTVKNGKDGERGETGQQGEKGEKGVGIREVSVEELPKTGKTNQYRVRCVFDNGESFVAGVISVNDGDNGAKLVKQEYIGEDENGNTKYKQTFDDGTTAEFVANRGLQGIQGERGIGVRSAEISQIKVDRTAKTYQLDITTTDGEKYNAGTFVVYDGVNGQQGPVGMGVPSGGNAGQILMKNSTMNYDTFWADIPVYGGGNGSTIHATDITVYEIDVNANIYGYHKYWFDADIKKNDFIVDGSERIFLVTDIYDETCKLVSDGGGGSVEGIEATSKTIKLAKPLQIKTQAKEEVTSLEFDISTLDFEYHIGDVSQYTIGNKYLCVYIEGLTNYYSTTDGTQRYTSNVVLIGFGQTLKAYSEPFGDDVSGDYVFEFNIAIYGSPDNCIVKQYGYAPTFSTIKIVDKSFNADTFVIPTGTATHFLPSESGTLATQEWVEKKSNVVLYMQGKFGDYNYDCFFALPTEGAKKITVVYTTQYNPNSYTFERKNENIVIWDNGQPIKDLYFNLCTEYQTNDGDYYAQVPLLWINNNTTADFQFYQADNMAMYNGIDMAVLFKIEY